MPKSIGLPRSATRELATWILDEERVRDLVPLRPSDSHKYRLGRVLVVAGSDQFVGAACLGSEAAARAGAGLVGVVSTQAVKQVLATRLPEATYPLTIPDLHEHPEASAEQVPASSRAFLCWCTPKAAATAGSSAEARSALPMSV